MRFKLQKSETTKHTEIINSVVWCGVNEVISISDDNIVYKWEVDSNQATKFMELEQYPTDIDFLASTKGQPGADVLAIGFVDGSFRLISKSGKLEKAVSEAHNGALISLRWSNDGAALASCGEDGQVKIWSRNGNLRSSLASVAFAVYSVGWGADSDSIIFSADKNIHIKPIQAGLKELVWKAHDALVLKVDWNASTGAIVSCGEDCRFKIWDSFGRVIFASTPYDFVITSVAWAPNGEYFAVGSFEMLRLCDKTGWTYSYDKTNVGSLMNVNWSFDSTIMAGAGATGQVLFAFTVDKSISWENWEINLTSDNKIKVDDLINELNEELDFKDRVISMSMAYGHLINWHTPQIIDIKDSISLTLQASKVFALVESAAGVVIYNYDGRSISNPKIPGVKFDSLSRKKVSLSSDTLGIVDPSKNKSILFYETSTGKPISFRIDHQMEILEVHLNNSEVSSERKVVFLDSNRDLYITPLHKKDLIKLCSMTDSFIWQDNYDILAALSDARLNVWFYPNAIYVDKELMDQCKEVKESTEIGRYPNFISFSNSQTVLRRQDGGLITLSVSPYPILLFDFCEKNKWDQAVKLCRYVNEQTLWACLAAYSLYSRDLDTAEIALAACESIEKVQFISKIKAIPSETAKRAFLALYFQKPEEAEQILIQGRLFYRALKMNIKLYKWDRALEIVTSQKKFLDILLGYRQRYLSSIEKEEFDPRFLKYREEAQNIDWEVIKKKIADEKASEK